MEKKNILIGIFAAAFIFFGFGNEVLANCIFSGYTCNIPCPLAIGQDTWATASDIGCCAGAGCSPSDDATVIAAAKSAYYSYYKSKLGASFGSNVTLTPPIKDKDGRGLGITDVIGNVIGFIFWLGIVICPIYIVWGGFEIATANGEEAKITSGKSKLTYAAIGLVIIALSGAMVTVIQKVLGVTP